MLSLLKPRYLVPVHGEFRHLRHHANTAISLGIPEDNIFILENGDCLEFIDGEARRTDNVAAGMFLVDAGAIAESSSGVMRERQRLSEDGMFIVVARINAQNGQLLGPPMSSPVASSARRVPTASSTSPSRWSARRWNRPRATASQTGAS